MPHSIYFKDREPIHGAYSVEELINSLRKCRSFRPEYYIAGNIGWGAILVRRLVAKKEIEDNAHTYLPEYHTITGEIVCTIEEK